MLLQLLRKALCAFPSAGTSTSPWFGCTKVDLSNLRRSWEISGRHLWDTLQVCCCQTIKLVPFYNCSAAFFRLSSQFQQVQMCVCHVSAALHEDISWTHSSSCSFPLSSASRFQIQSGEHFLMCFSNFQLRLFSPRQCWSRNLWKSWEGVGMCTWKHDLGVAVMG